MQSISEVNETKSGGEKTLPREEGCGVFMQTHKLHCFVFLGVTEQCNDSGRRGRNFFPFQMTEPKWKVILTEAGSTCGETDSMQFYHTYYKSVSLSSRSLLLSHSLSIHLSFSIFPFFFTSLCLCCSLSLSAIEI